ncbi:MAG: hypothetical protein PHN82_03495 [bacterium]|nr:hypothetical protein [bacterium]
MFPMPALAEVAEDWNFVSGRCAALEAELLESSFFTDLLRARTPAESHAQVAKSRHAPLFPHPGALGDHDRIIESDLEERIGEIGDLSPQDGPAEIFLKGIGIRRVHELLVRQEIARAGADEVRRWAERLEAGFPWLRGFRVPADARALFEEAPVRALSLWVDAAYLIEALRIAGRRPALRPYAEAMASLAAAKVIRRAPAGGIGPATLRAFFFRPPLPAPPPGALEALESPPPASAVLALAGVGDLALAEDEFDRRFGKAADDRLTRIAARGAREVYGPARVLWYLRRLYVEAFNMRLCLAAVLTPIDRRQAAARLRDA